ncbi:hypothetical protein [Pseudorhodoferax sp.]|uniref:hypothetical protein n=1 Tax=Pseudorhodoferax sp. TaxID=1993553 RepID=UPI002DD6866C|nr:hypothetical protein [Pseudorhodoferax sp.]
MASTLLISVAAEFGMRWAVTGRKRHLLYAGAAFVAIPALFYGLDTSSANPLPGSKLVDAGAYFVLGVLSALFVGVIENFVRRRT